MSRVCLVDQCENPANHIFPKDQIRRNQWLRAITHVKPGLIISTNSRVCSAHFKSTDFYTSFTRKVLRPDAVPSIFYWNQEVPKDIQKEQLLFDPSNVQKTYSRPIPVAYVEMPAVLNTLDNNNDMPDPLQTHHEVIGENLAQPQKEETEGEWQINSEDFDYMTEIEIPVQSRTEDDKNDFSVNSYTQTESNQTEINGFSIYNYKNNDKSLHFYTGLESFKKILLVFHSLGRSAYSLKYFYGNPPAKLDILEQFFITLIILRRHKTFEEITMLYNINLKQVYSIFITWIRFMSLQWKTIDLWVNKDSIRAHMPFDFHIKYPHTRVIIDATECPIKKPKLPLAQQITFSTYKNKNTIKFLVGITPGGLISYISPAYGGSASDRQIIERSDILEKFNYNDEIMVDKGLNVQDIFIPYGVKVNMPAFFKRGNQIGADTLTSNRRVASKRVHIERIIGMMKTFKILTQPMNQTEIMLSSDIVFIIAMLVNFRTNIINNDA